MWRLPRNVGTCVSTTKTRVCCWGSGPQWVPGAPGLSGWPLAAEAAAELRGSGILSEQLRSAEVGRDCPARFSQLRKPRGSVLFGPWAATTLGGLAYQSLWAQGTSWAWSLGLLPTLPSALLPTGPGAAGQNKQHSITKNTAKLDRETEELHHDRVTLEVGKVIQQGRQSKGLTQKDLATVSEPGGVGVAALLAW